MFPDCFSKKQLSENSFLFCFDLNKVPNTSQQIIRLAELIKILESQDYICSVKPDKRLRGSGLLVVFANTKKYYSDIKSKRSKVLQAWDIKK